MLTSKVLPHPNTALLTQSTVGDHYNFCQRRKTRDSARCRIARADTWWMDRGLQ